MSSSQIPGLTKCHALHSESYRSYFQHSHVTKHHLYTLPHGHPCPPYTSSVSCTQSLPFSITPAPLKLYTINVHSAHWHGMLLGKKSNSGHPPLQIHLTPRDSPRQPNGCCNWPSTCTILYNILPPQVGHPSSSPVGAHCRPGCRPAGLPHRLTVMKSDHKPDPLPHSCDDQP